MALEPGTRYSIADDCVIGLDGQGSNMANLLLVFMLRGVYTNWKQPIGYFLVSHSVAVPTQHSLIVEGIHAAHECGIRVIFEEIVSLVLFFIHVLQLNACYPTKTLVPRLG